MGCGKSKSVAAVSPEQPKAKDDHKALLKETNVETSEINEETNVETNEINEETNVETSGINEETNVETNEINEETNVETNEQVAVTHGGQQTLPPPGPLIGTYANVVLPRGAMTASSQYQELYRPEQCRLDSTRGWAPQSSGGRHEWLQFDFGACAAISSIITESRTDDIAEWLTQFELSYSQDGSTFQGHPQVFLANTGLNHTRENAIEPPISARYLRLHPTAWESHSVVKVEVFGVAASPGQRAAALADGHQAAQDASAQSAPSKGSPRSQLGDGEMRRLIGTYADLILPAESITSSSVYMNLYRPEQCRLDSNRGWAPKSPGGIHEWLQFDFGESMLISQITTRSRDDYIEEWMTQFQLSSSEHGTDFEVHPQTFTGNETTNHTRHNTIEPPLVGRYVRLHPTAWVHHSTVKVEMFGAPASPVVLTVTCQQGEEAHELWHFSCCGLSGDEVAAVSMKGSCRLSDLVQALSEKLSTPGRSLALMLPSGTLLEDPTGSLTLMELCADSNETNCM